MNAKETAFKILDGMDEGLTFTGGSLEYHIQSITGKYLYPATALRYMRLWRREHRKVVCINKARSLYQIGREV